MPLSAALELDFTDPAILATRALCAILDRSGQLDRPMLLTLMQDAHGGSAADGAWVLRDAYDALEAGQAQHLLQAALPSGPATTLAKLCDLVAVLLTRTVRSEMQVDLQQFSTPAPIAFLATRALHLTKADVVRRPALRGMMAN
jgi:hypothetical protein